MNKIKDELLNRKTLIFDMDGTILDLEKLNYECYKNTLKQFTDLDLNSSDYEKYFSGTKTYQAFESYLNQNSSKNFDIELLILKFREKKEWNLENKLYEKVKLKPYFKDFIHLAKQKGFKTCVATSTIKKFTELILEKLDIKNYFHLILTAEDTNKSKPDPEIFNLAITRLNSKPENSIVFEDSLNGVQAAKLAKVYCVGILTENKNTHIKASCDYLIQDYKELYSLLKDI